LRLRARHRGWLGLVPGALDECTGVTLAAGGRCQVFLRLDTFLAARPARPRG
jgi:hypothetical protein